MPWRTWNCVVRNIKITHKSMFWIGRNTQSQLYHRQNKRGFICSLSSVQQKCMLNAAVLPWEIWNCVVRNMKRLLAANPCCELAEIQWTNRVCMSGQIGWAPRSALAATKSDLPKFWQCPGLVHMLQNPIMYDMWGGTINIFSARSLWRKIPRSQGVRSPDPLPKWVGEPD